MPVRYNVIVSRLPDNDSEVSAEIAFQTIQRDDLEAIVERVNGRGVVSEEETAEFVVGLKLFGEILLRHRRNPLFASLFPHFREFMTRMKASVAKGADV